MEQYKLGEMEQRFAQLIWQHAPVSSSRLVQLCAELFDWKKSTTYTMLGRLCARGIFENSHGTVTACMSPEEFAAGQGEQFLNETFAGSLPLFLASFTRSKKLSDSEIEAIEALIAAHREETP